MLDRCRIASKHAKYQAVNPVSSRLVLGFLRTVERFVVPLGVGSVLDVGCGEGVVLKSLEKHLQRSTCVAIDLDPVEAADAARNLPGCHIQVSSAYELPFRGASFELVMCCEVLEHVDDPERALKELTRVASKHVLLSVPREPLWRALNVVRGAYLRDWGNTPGHINHWTAASFERFVGSELEVLKRAAPPPWTVLLGRKR